MFNNYLVLNETPEVMLYLFINNFELFKKYYKCYKTNKNLLIKNIKDYIKYNKIKYTGKKATIVLEGNVVNIIDISA